MLNLTVVFWLVFAATILTLSMGATRKQAKTVILLALAAMTAVGLIA